MNRKAFLCGVSDTPATVGYMADLAAALERRALEVIDTSEGPDAFGENVRVLAEDADCLVLNMNGRVPDEGAVFLAGVAFAAGKGVALFKDDDRAPFGGRDNSMILGLSDSFRCAKNMKDLPRMIEKEIAAAGKPADSPCAALLERIDGTLPDGPEMTGGRIYCSGPLFCPPEKEEMGRIAAALEDAGYSTYLPHRDGVEVVAMGAAGSPLANLPGAQLVSRRVERAIFNVDIYELLARCDAVVVNVDGRVPDEGAVVEAAVAAASGLPVIFYHLRGAEGIVNPTLKTAAQIFPLVDSIERIVPAVKEVLPQKTLPAKFPTRVAAAIAGGKKDSALLKKLLRSK